MPIISYTDRKSPKGKLATLAIYLALIVGGTTMVVPFLIMVTGSMSTAFDYERRSVLPRFLWSREDRFLRTLSTFFPPAHRGSVRQLRCYFPDLPETWQLWAQIGDDVQGGDTWARRELARLNDAKERGYLEAAASDYRQFAAGWDARETVLAYDNRFVAPFLRRKYGTLERFNAAWQVSIDDFAKASAAEWSGEPIDQPGYVPLVDVRYIDLLEFREAYRGNRFTPYLAGPEAPAGYLRPAALRYIWEDYVAGQGTGDGGAAGSPVSGLPPPVELPFPVPAEAPPALRRVWLSFLKSQFPIRHIEIGVDPARRTAFRAFLVERFRNVDYLNRVLASGSVGVWGSGSIGGSPGGPPVSHTPTPPNSNAPATVHSWEDVTLTPTIPTGPLAKVWTDFVRTQVPVEEWRVRDTLPEQAFQKLALAKHGSLQGINDAYGTHYTSLQQLGVPFGQALLVTFAHREWQFAFDQMTAGYRAVVDYLFQRGTAVQNTIILVGLAILITLTVNPLAGYALSRFRLRNSEKILVFCLATMAFPAAVAAIPGFLLLRDLGLLNTFAALVLPGAANGMTIFLLKGFFDSLPQELYEAATIDGAPEWQIFLNISIPLVKPILAVSMLNAFIHAYNGWEWAIIVCQNPKMWTVAVWTYQFYQNMSAQPQTVMAAFIINSIPVLLVFLFCQKIILRGIILPQLK